ncbi:MAG TPA: hypothetical protein VFC19_36410 [Candidatus Limnocylindrales bacterium]|nr:hypothetical protein [Candidatus Limnocylindrales bacterium]
MSDKTADIVKDTVTTTVKPTVRAKRAKRYRDTVTEFDAFTRRILRAYGNRVAVGDIEALRCLATLSTELDATLRLAVAGLRATKPKPHSWQAIADMLGISRQATMARYGDAADRGALDRRLIDAGLNITAATLVEVFADHHPGTPPVSACPGCGYRYPDQVTDCPTNATVRPLLRRRRGEDSKALDRLSGVQLADLLDLKAARTNRVAAARSARPAASPAHTEQTLFPLHGKD